VRLEGNYRGMSVHAAGLVITNRPIDEVCAMYTRERKDKTTRDIVKVTVVAPDKKDGEYLGLMKVDFLGLSTMGLIRIAIEHAGISLEELYAVPMDDPETLEAFRRNDVIGIFQFEGRATRLVNREVMPDDFGEITDINGLSRPGPLFSGTTADYIAIKLGKKQLEPVHPIWDDITKSTKGQMIYQEQVLRALKEIGQIPVTRVGEIRRIISQKLGEAQFNESAGDFVTGAARLGIDKDLAMHMWGRLVTSATYSFVYAHSASYAMLGFWCMWLKIHHPEAFYAAALIKSDEDGWPKLIKDAKRHGIDVLGVDPETAAETWTPGDKEVRAGFLQLPGVGPVYAAEAIRYRDTVHHLGTDHDMTLEDLINVKGIGEAKLAKILAIDPQDPFGLHRIERILQRVRDAIWEGVLPLRTPTHTSDELLDAAAGERVVWLGRVRLKEYKDYIEDERARTGDDVEEIRARMKHPDLPTGCVLHCYDDGDEDVYVRIRREKYPRFRKDLEAIVLDHSIILAVARKSQNSFGASLYVDQLYYLDPPEGI
jgi:DNA polymerase-3 subunit alpha